VCRFMRGERWQGSYGQTSLRAEEEGKLLRGGHVQFKQVEAALHNGAPL